MNDTQNLQVPTEPFMMLFAEPIQQPAPTITSYQTYAGVTKLAYSSKEDHTDDK